MPPRHHTPEHPFPSTFRHVIASQSRIGWKQLLYGRFTTEWIYLHEITCTSQDTKHRDGERWLTELIILIWTHLHKRWLHRNSFAHDKTTVTQTEDAQRQEITTLYSNQSSYHRSCQPVFATPLQNLLKQAGQAISSWLDHNLPFLRRNRITPTQSSDTISQNSNCQHRTSSDENNENSKTPSPSTLTQIGPRSERVSSPHTIPNTPRC